MIPSVNTPTSTFDNDQYLLEIITCGTYNNFETFVSNWLDNGCAGVCDPNVEVEGCVTDCDPIYPFPVILTPNFNPSTPQFCD